MNLYNIYHLVSTNNLMKWLLTSSVFDLKTLCIFLEKVTTPSDLKYLCINLNNEHVLSALKDGLLTLKDLLAAPYLLGSLLDIGFIYSMLKYESFKKTLVNHSLKELMDDNTDIRPTESAILNLIEWKVFTIDHFKDIATSYNKEYPVNFGYLKGPFAFARACLGSFTKDYVSVDLFDLNLEILTEIRSILRDYCQQGFFSQKHNNKATLLLCIALKIIHLPRENIKQIAIEVDDYVCTHLLSKPKPPENFIEDTNQGRCGGIWRKCQGLTSDALTISAARQFSAFSDTASEPW